MDLPVQLCSAAGYNVAGSIALTKESCDNNPLHPNPVDPAGIRLITENKSKTGLTAFKI